MTPGIYYDLPENAYHAAPGIGGSCLAERSVAHMLSKTAGEMKVTDEMEFGSVVDILLLTPDLAEERIVVAGKGENRPKNFRAVHAPKICMTWSGMEKARRVVASINAFAACNFPAAEALRAMLKVGKRQASFFWQDSELGGLACKGRTDLLHPDAEWALDLKLTTDASPDAWTKHVWSMGYHVQGAHYSVGLSELGMRAPDWYWLAVENDYPFSIGLYPMSRELRTAGIVAREQMLTAFLAAKDAPEKLMSVYTPSPVEIGLPRWGERELAEQGIPLELLRS